jgi:hypothetical protein
MTGYELGDRGFEVRVQVFFLLSAASRPALGAHPLSNEYRRFFPRRKNGWGVKLTNHLEISVEVKNTWIFTSTPPYTFVA